MAMIKKGTIKADVKIADAAIVCPHCGATNIKCASCKTCSITCSKCGKKFSPNA